MGDVDVGAAPGGHVHADWRSLAEAARDLLDPAVHDFIEGGAGDEVAVAGSRRALDRYRLRPRVLRDVAAVDATTTVLGTRLAAPILVAPMGGHALVHGDAEMATAAGASAAGVGYISSTAANVRLEQQVEVAENAWYQLYVFRDRGVTRDLVDRAVAAGYRAIVVTVDAPVLGVRRRDIRNRFQPQVRWANLEPYAAAALPEGGDGTAIMRYFAEQIDPSVTWEDIAGIADASGVPVAVKGVLTAEDATLAIEHGAAAVYVSNHGGRQLDRTIAPVDALPEVAAAVDGRVPVLVDGGIRSAGDVAVALGLGAAAVGIGRSVLWALAVGGREGVTGHLRAVVDEFERTLALLGVVRPGQVSGEHITMVDA